MQTKLLIGAILLSTTLTRANLIDLTPGGFNLTQPFPTVVSNFFGQYGLRMQNLAGADLAIGQTIWSPFTIFGSDHFSAALNGDFTSADVGWNLLGTGFHLQYVLAEGDENAGLAHLYAVHGKDQFVGDGFVTIDGAVIPLVGVTFTGSNQTTDTASTLALMGIGAVAVFLLHRHIKA